MVFLLSEAESEPHEQMLFTLTDLCIHYAVVSRFDDAKWFEHYERYFGTRVPR